MKKLAFLVLCTLIGCQNAPPLDGTRYMVCDSLGCRYVDQLPRDTIRTLDTLLRWDTVQTVDTLTIPPDTLHFTDTLTIRDTLRVVDTLRFTDTLTVTDTLELWDTLRIVDTIPSDTIYVYTDSSFLQFPYVGWGENDYHPDANVICLMCTNG